MRSYRKIYERLKKIKIAIVSDHAGFFLKERLLKYLIKENQELKDFYAAMVLVLHTVEALKSWEIEKPALENQLTRLSMSEQHRRIIGETIDKICADS